jgi:hypothetical protein
MELLIKFLVKKSKEDSWNQPHPDASPTKFISPGFNLEQHMENRRRYEKKKSITYQGPNRLSQVSLTFTSKLSPSTPIDPADLSPSKVPKNLQGSNLEKIITAKNCLNYLSNLTKIAPHERDFKTIDMLEFAAEHIDYFRWICSKKIHRESCTLRKLVKCLKFSGFEKGQCFPSPGLGPSTDETFHLILKGSALIFQKKSGARLAREWALYHLLMEHAADAMTEHNVLSNGNLIVRIFSNRLSQIFQNRILA